MRVTGTKKTSLQSSVEPHLHVIDPTFKAEFIYLTQPSRPQNNNNRLNSNSLSSCSLFDEGIICGSCAFFFFSFFLTEKESSNVNVLYVLTFLLLLLLLFFYILFWTVGVSLVSGASEENPYMPSCCCCCRWLTLLVYPFMQQENSLQLAKPVVRLDLMPYLLWLWVMCFGLPIQCRCCWCCRLCCWWPSDDAGTRAARCGGKPEPRWRGTGSGWSYHRGSFGSSTFCWPAPVGGLKRGKKTSALVCLLKVAFLWGKNPGQISKDTDRIPRNRANWSRSPLQQHQLPFLPPVHKLWTPFVEFLLFLEIIGRERHELHSGDVGNLGLIKLKLGIETLWIWGMELKWISFENRKHTSFYTQIITTMPESFVQENNYVIRGITLH